MMSRGQRGNAGKERGGIRWRRAVTRAGLPLAVFALMLQAAVAFAHHHVPRAHPHPPAHRSADAAVVRLLLPAAPVACPSADGPQAPLVPARELCFLCTVIHAAAAPVAEAPPLALPLAYAGLRLAPLAASAPLAQRAAAFDARGPPRV